MSGTTNHNVVRLKDIRSGEMVDQLAKTVSSMADQLTDRIQVWSSKARGVARSTDGFVRTSPWQAVGIIALAGLAAGIVVAYGARGWRRGGPSDGQDGPVEVSGG